MNTITTMFGGEDRTFGFGLNEIEEIQRTCRTGLGSIIERVMSNEFYFEDIYHGLRLGLIGGGECNPTRAMELVNLYVIGKPLADPNDPSSPLNVAKVMYGNIMFGVAVEDKKTKNGEEGTTTDLSTSPQSEPLPSDLASAQ